VPQGVRTATFRLGLREQEFTEARMNARNSWMAALSAAVIMIASAGCSSASGAVPAGAVPADPGPAPEDPDITTSGLGYLIMQAG
jgi:hypothetical protein